MSPSRELTEDEARSFDRHYQAGWALLKKVMLVGAKQATKGSGTRDAADAIAHFGECLEMVPDSWPSMWAIGKARQATGNHDEALTWFERALASEAGNSDVWREAAISACAVGDARKAMQYADGALKLKPDDAGLHANAALGRLLAGSDLEAERMANRACELDPRDPVSQRVADLVRAVGSGARERPRSI